MEGGILTILLMLVAVFAGLAVWYAVARFRHHRRELQRLRGAILTLASDYRAVPPRWQDRKRVV